MIHLNLRHRLHRFIRLPSEIAQQIRFEHYRKSHLPRMVEECRQRMAGGVGDGLEDLRRRTLDYIETNHRPEFGVGAYSYVPGGPPILYASCYAALTRHLYGDLGSLTETNKAEWAAHIQQFQTDDGLFRDPVIDCPEADDCVSWGWRHLTIHALMALRALGNTANKPFEILDAFRAVGATASWLKGRNWKTDAANVSNEIQNVGTLFQYARDFQSQDWCTEALSELFDWLDRHQDRHTGYWGYGSRTPRERSLGVQTGYHLWLLYFYDSRPLQFVERIVDSCLITQNELGGFGADLNSSACEDIDTIDPLVRLSFQTDYRREEVLSTLERAVPWVLSNLNPDGGWVFRRGQAFRYGHDLMSDLTQQSSMFPTWFRTLSLAYLAQVLDSGVVPVRRPHFVHCPGVQFLSTSER